MNRDTQGMTLLDALNGLESTNSSLRRAAQHRYIPRLERLQHAAESIGLTTIAQPPSSSDEYLQNWQRYLEDPQQHLTPRALRYLCWEPDVALTNRFLSYLDKDASELSARMLQGLVHSCHARWSLAFAAGTIAHGVKRRLEIYRGPHRVLARWREHADMFLGPHGHCIFANALLVDGITLKQHCEAWSLEESSPYVLEAMRHAVRLCLGRLEHEPAWQTHLICQHFSGHKISLVFKACS